MNDAVFVLGGDPAAIRASAARWMQSAVSAGLGAAEVAGLSAAGTFFGDEGMAHSTWLTDRIAPTLSSAGDAWGRVGEALNGFAVVLEDCQSELKKLASMAADGASQISALGSRVAASHELDTAQRDRAALATAGALMVTDGPAYVSDTPALAARMGEAQQSLQGLHTKAVQVRQRHDEAMRQCCARIDAAKATRTSQPVLAGGAVSASAGGSGRWLQSAPMVNRSGVGSTAAGLATAAFTSTGVASWLGVGSVPAARRTDGDGVFDPDKEHPKNYTSKHNAAADKAAQMIESKRKYVGGPVSSQRIARALEEPGWDLLRGLWNKEVNANPGWADLVSEGVEPIDPGTDVQAEVWEVKSVGESYKAGREAQWYSDRINVVRGTVYARPGEDYHFFTNVDGYPDTYVWSMGSGVVIYGSRSQYVKKYGETKELDEYEQQREQEIAAVVAKQRALLQIAEPTAPIAARPPVKVPAPVAVSPRVALPQPTAPGLPKNNTGRGVAEPVPKVGGNSGTGKYEVGAGRGAGSTGRIGGTPMQLGPAGGYGGGGRSGGLGGGMLGAGGRREMTR